MPRPQENQEVSKWRRRSRTSLRWAHLSQTRSTDQFNPDLDGWSVWHVTCHSACKLDSPNYHINDVSSFIRLRACISNSFAHAWRSQEKAITPFGLEFYFKFQSKWACLVTLTELVETPDFFLLPLLVLWSSTSESKPGRIDSRRFDIQKFQCCIPFARFECFGERICSLESGLDVLQRDLRIIKQFIQGGQV